MSISRAWISCFLTGLLVLGLTGYIFPIFPQEMAVPQGIETPVYAFEFARNQADLIAIFGAIDDPLRADRIESMDEGNRVDLIYMAIYSMFICLFFYAAHLKYKRAIWLAFAAIGIVAGIADAVENTILFSLTADLETAENLVWLKYPVHVKFTALYLCSYGLGMLLKEDGRKGLQILGRAFQVLSLAAIFLTFVGMGAVATLVISIAWISKLIYAGREYRACKN